MSSARQTYVVNGSGSRWTGRVAACRSLLDLVRASAVRVTVDAYSDYHDDQPPDVAEVEHWLRGKGASQGHQDPGMGVAIDPRDDVEWKALCLYAPWSIDVELWDGENEPLVMLSDSGSSLSAVAQ